MQKIINTSLAYFLNNLIEDKHNLTIYFTVLLHERFDTLIKKFVFDIFHEMILGSQFFAGHTGAAGVGQGE